MPRALMTHREAVSAATGAAVGAAVAVVVTGGTEAGLGLAGAVAVVAGLLVVVALGARARRRAAAEARTDRLTGLANRTALEEAAARLLPAGDVALLLLDLDRFKEVNDTLGHAAGDELLVQVAAALRSAVRGDDLVVRLGGDEFAVLLPGVRDATVPLRVARSLWDAVRRPYRVAGTPVTVGVSIGIALSGEHGATLDALSAAADRAMYRSKRTQVGPLVADGAPSRPGALPAQASTRLATALASGATGAALQPRLGGAGRLVAVHAVPTWDDPQTGAVAPEAIAAAAEALGLGAPLLGSLLDTALPVAVAPDGRPLRLAVSLPRGVLTAEGTVPLVAGRLGATGRPPDLLELHVDVADLEADPAAATDRLTALRALGVRTALAQAGHALPAPRLLRSLPLDAAVVDAPHVDDPALLEVLVGLVEATGLTALICGVEDAGVAALAPRSAEVSGPAVCHPLTPDLFRVWAADRRSGTRRRRVATPGSRGAAPAPTSAGAPVPPRPRQRRSRA